MPKLLIKKKHIYIIHRKIGWDKKNKIIRNKSPNNESNNKFNFLILCVLFHSPKTTKIVYYNETNHRNAKKLSRFFCNVINLWLLIVLRKIRLNGSIFRSLVNENTHSFHFLGKKKAKHKSKKIDGKNLNRENPDSNSKWKHSDYVMWIP